MSNFTNYYTEKIQITILVNMYFFYIFEYIGSSTSETSTACAAPDI